MIVIIDCNYSAIKNFKDFQILYNKTLTQKAYIDMHNIIDGLSEYLRINKIERIQK